MRNMYKHLLVTGLLLSSQAFAIFDEKRQGIMLGLGIGLHSTDNEFTVNGIKLPAESESGIATSIKFGGGFNEQFQLYYVRNASWYTAPAYTGFGVENITFTLGISGIGGTYYFSPAQETGFVSAGIGIGDLSAPLESNIDPDTGGAFMLGGGYIFKNHVSLEANLLSTDIDSSSSSGFGFGPTKINMASSSLQFTVNYLFY